MNARKSPTESATQYKIGTKRTGNDNNKWIVVENKNGIKRWAKYPRPAARKTFSTLDLYDIQKIKKNNWDEWMKTFTATQKNLVHKFRSSYKDMEQTMGIVILEVILPKSDSGVYWIDYVWDYAGIKFPGMLDSTQPYLFVTYLIDQDLNLKKMIEIQHLNISKTIGNRIVDYGRAHFNGKMHWPEGKNKILYLEV